ELDRTTMARGVGACGALVRPLVEALRRYVMMPGKVHADDTPLPVLAPGKGQTKTGRLWMGLRSRRSRVGIGRCACGLVRLHAKSPGPAPPNSSGWLPRHPAGRRVCGLQRHFYEWQRTRSRLHGSCAT